MLFSAARLSTLRIIELSAFCFTDVQLCEICKTRLISNDLNSARRLIIFECKHAYHETCLPGDAGVRGDCFESPFQNDLIQCL
jgi:hypothetical protein